MTRAEIFGQLRVRDPRIRRLPVQNRVEHHRRRLALERLAPGGHLIEHQPEREKIGAGVELFAARLLRRHVVDRAEGHAGHRQDVARDPRLGRGIRRFLAELRDTEVEQLGLPSFRDEDVRRLDVSVNDALGVRGIERVGELAANVQDLLKRQGMPMDAAAKRFALEQLHRDEVPALVHADVVDRADVRVIERRRDSCFPQEPLDVLRRHAVALGQELQRDVPAKPRVLGLIDDAHPAGTELADDAIVLDLLADHVERL